MTARLQRMPIVMSLATDPLVLAYLAVFAGMLVFYLVPVIPAGFRQNVGMSLFMVPFVAIALAGSLVELDQIPSREERRFWQAVAVACGTWLAALIVKAWFPGDDRPMAAALVVDVLFLASYLPLLLAVEWRPHQRVPVGFRDPHLRVHVIGVSTVCAGWFIYAVLVPVWFDAGSYESSLSTSLLFLAIDVTLAALYFSLGRQCPVPRWRVLYTAVGVAALTIASSDTLDLLLTTDTLGWTSGQLTDLFWLLPSFTLLLAVRLRHAPLGPVDTAAPETPGYTLQERSRTGGMILVGAFMFPFGHLWLTSLHVASPAVVRAQSVVVLIMLGALSVVAMVAYRVLDRRYEKLARTQRVLQGRLREAQRLEAIGRLAGGVSHDFNNILTSIVGYNDLALDALAADDPSRPALEEIARSAARASELTGQLLALSRRQILKPERMDLTRVVEEIGPTLRRIIGEDVAIETDLTAHPYVVMADPSQIRWAVLTLAANARAAMPGGGQLVISTSNSRITADNWPVDPVRSPGDYAELTVRDTGPAIPPADQPHVFEPFHSTRPQGRGTGLGLAAVHGIVVQSGGMIDVRTNVMGHTEFVVRLPRAADVIVR
jgi:signal transduction histidine kinase